MWQAILSALGPVLNFVIKVKEWFTKSTIEKEQTIKRKNQKAKEEFKSTGRPK